jgi:rhamnosyltransferase subunit B
MGVGLELQRRGHAVTIGTSAVYEPKVRTEGLDFTAIRPDLSIADPAWIAGMMDAKRGTERVIKRLAASVRESYADCLRAAGQADLVVTHPIPFGVVFAVRKLEVPWVSALLAPISLFSRYDPPVPAPAPWLVKLRALGPGAVNCLFALARRQSLGWVRPVVELQKELGLQSMGHPLFEAQHSPRRVLAMFSGLLASPQPDWPPQTVVTGFPFYDRHHEQPGMPPDLERFLSDGPPPIVFTLGSSAVMAAGEFYRTSLEAAQRLGFRAVFLTGKIEQGLPTDAMAAQYAPHSELFPRAAAIVHHGGIGTTAQAMRSGRPMLVVPFAHDQFDNGARVKRLGIAEVLYRTRYTAATAERALRPLLEDPRYAKSGARVAAQIATEDGIVTAADEIESR